MEREVYINDKPVKINIKEKLNYIESIGFVSSIVYSLIDEDTMSITYALKEYEIRLKTIQFFTDYKFPEISEKDAKNDTKVEKYLNNCFSIVFDTYIYDEIKQVVDPEFYNNLLEAVDKQLGFEIQKMQNNLKAETEMLLDQFAQISDALRVFQNIDIDQVMELIPVLQKFDPNSDEFIKKVLANSNQKKSKSTDKGKVLPIIKGQIKMPLDDEKDEK